MAKNLTTGKPLKLIMEFAVPLLAGNLLQQTYNIVDAAIVGKYLGSDQLASVGASSSVQFLVLGFCMGTCNGFSIPVAQKFGADDHKGMRSSIFNSAILAVVLSIILTVACALGCSGILQLLKTPDKIFDDAYKYLLVIFLGIPCTILYNFLSGILRAVGDSKTPFLFLVISTVLNIILDLVCIIVFKWGCMGAAIATITAQGISGILCFMLIRKKYDILKLTKEDRVYDKKNMWIMAIIGIPMGLQFSITAIGSMVLQSVNNGLGEIYISAFTAGMRIKMFAMCPYDAIATAVSTFVSQNYGAKKYDRIKKGIVQGIVVGLVYAVLVFVVLAVFGRLLSLIFINREDTAVLDASAMYLKYLGMFYWAIAFLNVCRMCTQGLGFTGRAIFSGVVEMIARIVVAVVFVPMFGFTAVCFADQTAWVCACFYIVPTCIYCVKKLKKQDEDAGLIPREGI